MKKIYFWRDVHDDQAKFAPYQDLIQRLCQGEHAGLKIEKLRKDTQPAIYSLRISKKTEFY